MPHKFLHRRIEWSSNTRVVLISSICLWIPFAYLLFSFAWGLKEVFRLFTTDRGEIPFLTLTTSEQNFYAFWYASLALVITFGLVARPMLLLRLSPNGIAARRRSGIATDLQNLTNMFLYVFIKLAGMYWAVGIMLGTNYYFDLYRHRYWMILLVAVLFGNQWLSLNRVYKRAGLKWMALTFAWIVLMSFVFSRVPVIKPSLLDNMVAKREPSTYFRLDLPMGPSEAVTSDEILGYRRSRLKIGVGFPLHRITADAEIFVNEFPFDSTWSKDVDKYIVVRKMDYDEVEQDRIDVRLSVDSNVKMSVVKTLKTNLTKLNIRRIFFIFKSNPFITYLPQWLRANCDDYYSGRAADSVDTATMAPMFCSDDAILIEPHLVIVGRGKDVLVNGIKMNVNRVHKACVDFLNDGDEAGTIKLFADDDLTFDRYILIYNEVLRAYRDYLDERYSMELGYTYRQVLQDPYHPDYSSRDKISAKVDMSAFYELTNAEKDFMIRKVPAPKAYFEGSD